MSLFEQFYGPSHAGRLEFTRLEMPAEEKNETYTRSVSFANGEPLASYENFVDAQTDSFVKDGVWHKWNSNSVLIAYGHFREGQHHGRRFAWNSDGTLSRISAYDSGRLIESVNRNLHEHPAYATAQRIAGGNE